MNQPLLERERVNERLQRRTRRAWTARSVDLAVNVGLVEIRRTDLGEHVHCAGIDQKHRCVFDPAIVISRHVISYSPLNRLLFFQIERGNDVGRDAALRRPVGAARRPYPLTSGRPNLVWRFVIPAVAHAANYGHKTKI